MGAKGSDAAISRHYTLRVPFLGYSHHKTTWLMRDDTCAKGVFCARSTKGKLAMLEDKMRSGEIQRKILLRALIVDPVQKPVRSQGGWTRINLSWGNGYSVNSINATR